MSKQHPKNKQDEMISRFKNGESATKIAKSMDLYATSVVEKAEIVKTERDGCLTKNTLITCKAIDELCEALSHPLVQEYLKKEKV